MSFKKFILLSDVHATSSIPRGRVDNPLKAFERKINFVFQKAEEEKADIIQAGDLFNSPRDILALFKFLSIKQKYPDINFYCIYGQHDLYNRNKKSLNNLNILSKANAIKLLGGRKPEQVDNICIYGCNYGKNEKMPRPFSRDKINILVIHAPISGVTLPWKGFEYTSAGSFLEKYKDDWDLILCGDIHRNFIIKNEGKIICNTGPIMRLEATKYNMNHKPSLFLYSINKNTQTIKKIVIPHAKSCQVLDDRHLENFEESNILDDININKKKFVDFDIYKIIEVLIKKSENEESIRDVIKTISDDIDI